MLDQSVLQEVAEITGVSSAKMKELLLSPQSRILAIRLYLASLILSRCGIQASKGESLLPPEVAAFAAFITGIDKKDASKATPF